MGFNPKDYTEVKDRLKWYKDDYPDYRVETDLVSWGDNHDSVIVKAWIYKNAEEQEKRIPHATGLAEELRDAGYINKTSHVENCETSAIGRALANINYHGSDKRPSKEEMDKVKRTEKAKAKPKSKPKSEPKPKQKKDEVEADVDMDDYTEKINSFEDEGKLVEWFNKKIKSLADNQDEQDAFRETYTEIVRDRLNEVR